MWSILAVTLALSHGSTPDCVPTPLQDRLPKVIAPMMGDGPVRLVQGLNGHWIGAPIKSVWVIDRKVAGDLIVIGHRVDGPERLQFQAEIHGPISEVLTKVKPLDQSMIPGGADVDVMRRYAFVSSYVIYPTPGCWALDVKLGSSRRQIVVSLK